jgi:serralysin
MKIFFLCLLTAISIEFCAEQKPKELDSATVYKMATEYYYHDSERVEYMMPHPVQAGVEKLGALNGRKWPKGQNGTTEIKITFKDGAPDLQAYCKELWRQYIEAKTNIRFKYVADNESPDERISFTPNNQSWSYMGTDCKYIANIGNITMNLGWLTNSWSQKDYKEITRVAVHEQFHAIHYVHNQNSPSCASVIKYNTDVIYAKYAKMGWTKDMVDQNVLMFYSDKEVTDNGCDLSSIMQYQIGAGEANVTAGVNYYPSSLDNVKLIMDYPPLKVEPPVVTTPNLALNKPARQLSDYPGYPAANAFDGNVNTFSHTLMAQYPWVQVDLGQTANVTGLDIVGRQGCCQYRIREFKIYVSNSNSIPVYTDPALYAYSTGAAGLNRDHIEGLSGSGRYITLMAKNFQAGDFLSIAELSVLGAFGTLVCKDSTVTVHYKEIIDRDSTKVIQVCR